MRIALISFWIIVVSTVVGCGKPLAPPLELPTADQIAEMRVSVPLIEQLATQPIPEFSVSSDAIPKILFWLLPTKPDQYSVSQGVERGIYFHVADIAIRTKDGREFHLRCHDWGKNPVAFTPNGKDWYLGRIFDEQGVAHAGAMALLRAIKDAHLGR